MSTQLVVVCSPHQESFALAHTNARKNRQRLYMHDRLTAPFCCRSFLRSAGGPFIFEWLNLFSVNSPEKGIYSPTCINATMKHLRVASVFVMRGSLYLVLDYRKPWYLLKTHVPRKAS